MFGGSAFLIWTLFCVVDKAHGVEIAHMHSVVLDPNGVFLVHWLVIDDKIQFNLEVQAKGYIGFGLSKTGGMAGSDIVTGWVKNGEVHFQDRHGEGRFLPPIDSKQNWELISGLENDSHTVLSFQRKLKTCDDEDMDIDESTIRLIYAYTDEDPTSDDEIPYHHAKRGARSVMLLQPNLKKDIPTEDVSHWDIRTPNLTLPSHMKSVYWCSIVKGPELSKEHHIIKIEPLLQPGNEQYVHHVVLYECAIGNSTELEIISKTDGHQCYHPNMPDEMTKCDAMITAWGVGGEAVVLPEHAGIPLRKSPPKYYLMEVHYDNPALHAGIQDASGVRISYTPHLRKYDAGTLMIGGAVTPRMFIPPGQPSFTIAGHSHPNCFDPAIEGGEIKLLGTLLHAHLLGKELKARHFRGDVELPTLAENVYYDFNYQEYIMFKEEVVFKKGDQITVECKYDSRGRNETTYGGLFTDEEMCLAFILYYPRIERFGCMSVATAPLIQGLINIDIDLARGFDFQKYYNMMDVVDWSKVNMTVVENAMRYSPHDVFCYTGNGDKFSVMEKISYPVEAKPYVKEETCKTWEANPILGSSAHSHFVQCHTSSVMLFVSILLILIQ